MKISTLWNKIIEWIKNYFDKKESQPDPEPTPAPEPIPTEDFAPPERKGVGLYNGDGKFNTYKDIGRNKESSNKQAIISGWFAVKNWSGGGSEQPKGFCFVNKGLVGSHWGINLTIRPDQIVWNATKGEIVANCKVPTGSWHHVKAEVDPSSVKLWFDGKLLKTEPKKFNGSLLQDSNESIRLGGYQCPYPQATWFNQSLNGQMSDVSVEIK